jgi:transcriptional regulator with XRE-family HTH domain
VQVAGRSGDRVPGFAEGDLFLSAPYRRELGRRLTGADQGHLTALRDAVGKLRPEREADVLPGGEPLQGLGVWIYPESWSTDRLAEYPAIGADEVTELAGKGQRAAGELSGRAGLTPPFTSYLAVLCQDTDSLGKALSRLAFPTQHQDVGGLLAAAADRHDEIVRRHLGRVVYSGGDDLLALLPAATALEAARDLHEGTSTILATNSHTVTCRPIGVIGSVDSSVLDCFCPAGGAGRYDASSRFSARTRRRARTSLSTNHPAKLAPSAQITPPTATDIHGCTALPAPRLCCRPRQQLWRQLVDDDRPGLDHHRRHLAIEHGGTCRPGHDRTDWRPVRSTEDGRRRGLDGRERAAIKVVQFVQHRRPVQRVKALPSGQVRTVQADLQQRRKGDLVTRDEDHEPADAARRQEIATRVEYWMARRGMTRKVFGDRLGKSLSWVDKIKRGDRQLDRLSVLRQIAQVLDISLYTLIDEDEAERARSCTDVAEVAAIKEALERYDGLTGDITITAADLPRLRRSLHYGWHAFQSANYQVVGRLLPDLLVGLQQAYRGLDGSDRDTAAELLTQAYWLSAQICFKLARFDLGWVAADRGIQVAEWTGDLTLIGHTTRRIVEAMMAGTDDSAQRALALVHTTADRLDTNLDRVPMTYLSAYGMLLLKGSIAAARLDNAALSRDLNLEAGRIAGRLGEDRNDHWTAFGPTNVAVRP